MPTYGTKRTSDDSAHMSAWTSASSATPFKGRVSALGPNINFNFKLGQTPVLTQLRWPHEFTVENRLTPLQARLTE